MSPLVRPVVVAPLALAVGLAIAACGGVVAPPGADKGTADRATTTPNPVAVPGAPVRPTGPTQDATLVRVVDGDTIRVMVGGTEERVRYLGMDAPELNASSAATPEPYAAAASAANAGLLAGGRLVLETDVSERDQFGRLLRDIWVERDGTWTLVNLALVAEGYAQVATYPPDVKYVEALRVAQRAARDGGRGLWGGSPP